MRDWQVVFWGFRVHFKGLQGQEFPGHGATEMAGRLTPGLRLSLDTAVLGENIND